MKINKKELFIPVGQQFIPPILQVGYFFCKFEIEEKEVIK